MKGEVTRECILEITWWWSNSSPPKKTLFTKYKHAKLLKSKAHNWHIWQKWFFYGIPVKTLFCNFYLHELHNTPLVFFMWDIKILIWLLLTHIHVFQACINVPSVLSRYRSARCWHAWTHVETDWSCPLCAILTQSDKIWSVVYWCNVDDEFISVSDLSIIARLTCICVISPGLRKSLCNKWEFWEV